MESLNKNIQITPTMIQQISIQLNNNSFFIKRDDLIPFSFGGNKARKSVYFFNKILSEDFDTVVTYGSGSSNHCRVIANACAKYNLKCYIISPEENYTPTFNSLLVKKFGAEIIKAPLDKISETITQIMTELSKTNKPYFIQGGGHGNLGTQAYVDAYNEICKFEEENNNYFDYIFHASGTGTTQAGLICGSVLAKDIKRKIVGISIARKNPRGTQIIEQSIEDYLKSINFISNIPKVMFDDSYICGNYGGYNEQIVEQIDKMMAFEGIPLSRTYSAKAFWGMLQYIKKEKIIDKNILFINTGGSPLFFDDLEDKI